MSEDTEFVVARRKELTLDEMSVDDIDTAYGNRLHDFILKVVLATGLASLTVYALSTEPSGAVVGFILSALIGYDAYTDKKALTEIQEHLAENFKRSSSDPMSEYRTEQLERENESLRNRLRAYKTAYIDLCTKSAVEDYEDSNEVDEHIQELLSEEGDT